MLWIPVNVDGREKVSAESSVLHKRNVLQNKVIKPTSKFGSVIVTCSPLPTSSFPSHAVSMEAGLKSSMNRKKTFIFHNNQMSNCRLK